MASKTPLLLGLSFAIVLLIASEVAAKDLAEASTTSTTVSVHKSKGAVEDKNAVKYAKYDQSYEGYPGGGYGEYPGDGYEGGRGGYEDGRGGYEGGRVGYEGGRVGYEGGRGGYEGRRGAYEGGRVGYEGGRGGYEGGRGCYYGYCGNRCCNAAEVEPQI